MLRILSVILVLTVTSCITEDPKGADQPLEYLNGEKYSAKSNVNIGPFPMTTSIKRKSKDTLVKGCVTIKGSSDFYQSPLKVEKLVLSVVRKLQKYNQQTKKVVLILSGNLKTEIIPFKLSRCDSRAIKTLL